ncbi:MAG: hypothetical protein QOC96_2108 [Acidobacteriota bacterium]|jgi:hypothetical protein|nr:hypothetical protein [Acidobacteriota bacterium]
MKQCPTCKRTYSDNTLAFCLVDGAVLSAPDDDPQATLVLKDSPSNKTAPTLVSPSGGGVMSITGEKINQQDAADKTRRIVFIIAGLAAVLLIAGLVIYLIKKSQSTEGNSANTSANASAVLDKKLEGGLRAGSSEFEKYRNSIKLDEPEAEYSDTYAGGMQMTLATTVRNFTGRTINGLEMKGTVTDLDGKPIKERTMVVIPSPSGAFEELENNGTARVPIPIPGFQGADAANIDSGQAKLKMEVTAIKFK